MGDDNTGGGLDQSAVQKKSQAQEDADAAAAAAAAHYRAAAETYDDRAEIYRRAGRTEKAEDTYAKSATLFDKAGDAYAAIPGAAKIDHVHAGAMYGRAAAEYEKAATLNDEANPPEKAEARRYRKKAQVETDKSQAEFNK